MAYSVSNGEECRVKHYAWQEGGSGGRPSLVFGVRIDGRDVRTGCSTCEVLYLKGIDLGDADLNWTPEMVSAVDPDCLFQVQEQEPFRWPDYADEQLFRHVTRHFRPKIWANHRLKLYSHLGESREDFLSFCFEEVFGARAGEMRKIRQAFRHRFDELGRRLEKQAVAGAWDHEAREDRLSRVKSFFFAAHNELSELFLSDAHQALGEGDLLWRIDLRPEFQHQVDKLRQDLISRYNAVVEDFETQASAIEPEEVVIQRSAVEIFSRDVLWE